MRVLAAERMPERRRAEVRDSHAIELTGVRPGACTVRMFAARGDVVGAEFGPLVFARVEFT